MLLPHSKTLAISISDVTRPTPRTKGAVTDITKARSFSTDALQRHSYRSGTQLRGYNFLFSVKKCRQKQKLGAVAGAAGGGDCSESRHCALLLVAGRTKRLRGSARDDVCYDGKGRKETETKSCSGRRCLGVGTDVDRRQCDDYHFPHRGGLSTTLSIVNHFLQSHSALFPAR